MHIFQGVSTSPTLPVFLSLCYFFFFRAIQKYRALADTFADTCARPALHFPRLAYLRLSRASIFFRLFLFPRGPPSTYLPSTRYKTGLNSLVFVVGRLDNKSLDEARGSRPEETGTVQKEGSKREQRKKYARVCARQRERV